MTSQPTVSVVIPTYNRSDLIAETLVRVMAQTRPADQIIVVDDGSTDDTRSVLAGYGSQIQAITIPNSGELVARNTGLRAASGQLVAFCDSDDLWEPELLAEMVVFWQQGRNPICAYSNFRLVSDGQWHPVSKFNRAPAGYWNDLEDIHDGHGWLTQPVIRDLLTFQPFFPSCMMVARARFLALGGWDEGVSRKVGCDLATTLRMGENPPIGVLQKPLVGIRKHPNNFSADAEKTNLGDAEVLEYALAKRPTLARYAPEIRECINSRRRDAFDLAFGRGDFPAVKRISAQLLPGRYGARHRVKHTIAGLPQPLRDLAQKLMSPRVQ